MSEDNWIAGAVEALAGGANTVAIPIETSPRQEIETAITSPEPSGHSPSQPLSASPSRECNPALARDAEPNSARPYRRRSPKSVRRADPNSGGGHLKVDTQFRDAPTGTEPRVDSADTSFSGGHATAYTQPPAAPADTEFCAGQPTTDTHVAGASAEPLSGGDNLDLPPTSDTHLPEPDPVIAQIVERWRVRQDMLRARQRLELQAQAICRRSCGGDKVAGAKLWAEVKKNPEHPMRVWLTSFIMAMEPIDAAKAGVEKVLAKLSRKLPVHGWAKGVPGLGEVSLSAIVGECATGPGEYKSVSALWKRMGLAVINGGRQRKVSGADALDHGYNAERRSLMWNIGGCLIKAQIRSTKGEDGKKIEGSEFAIGQLGQVYLDRKAYMRAKNEAGEYAERAAGIVAKDKKLGKAPNKENLAGHLTPIHIHNDSQRYMEKRLLRTLWQEWRRATGRATTIHDLPDAEYLEAAE